MCVITQVPSPGLPQEESIPRAPHAKNLHCLMVSRAAQRTPGFRNGLPRVSVTIRVPKIRWEPTHNIWISAVVELRRLPVGIQPP